MSIIIDLKQGKMSIFATRYLFVTCKQYRFAAQKNYPLG